MGAGGQPICRYGARLRHQHRHPRTVLAPWRGRGIDLSPVRRLCNGRNLSGERRLAGSALGTLDARNSLIVARKTATSAARRLDDAFRQYLAERGTKLVGLADIVILVTGVAALRHLTDGIADLWANEMVVATALPASSTAEIRATAQRIARCYADLATSLRCSTAVPSVPEQHNVFRKCAGAS
jgi:hypothetical protein